METIGHHTCNKEGGEEHVNKNAPFISPINSAGSYPFLGVGYYFWDNNLSLAKYWGEFHYKNDYFIIESQIKMSNPDFFDLLGNRTHMILFESLYNRFSFLWEKRNQKKWPIGKFIDYLRKVNEKEIRGIFPYKICRAIDLLRSEQVKQSNYYFGYGKDNYTNLSPCIVICLYEKNSASLLNQKIIHQN